MLRTGKFDGLSDSTKTHLLQSSSFYQKKLVSGRHKNHLSTTPTGSTASSYNFWLATTTQHGPPPPPGSSSRRLASAPPGGRSFTCDSNQSARPTILRSLTWILSSSSSSSSFLSFSLFLSLFLYFSFIVDQKNWLIAFKGIFLVLLFVSISEAGFHP